MTRAVLLAALEELLEAPDPVMAHWRADLLLLAYIGDVEVLLTFERLPRDYGRGLLGETDGCR